MNRNQKQFTEIYDRYVQNIYRFVYIKVSSSQIAEDITSEVFLKSWEKFKQINTIKNPRAYLYTVARNLVVDFYREKPRAVISIEEIEIPGEMGAEQAEKEKSDLIIVKKALNKLNPEYQDIIILRHVNKVPIKDIARIMDKSKNATRVMLHRAIEQLKQEAKT